VWCYPEEQEMVGLVKPHHPCASTKPTSDPHPYRPAEAFNGRCFHYIRNWMAMRVLVLVGFTTATWIRRRRDRISVCPMPSTSIQIKLKSYFFFMARVNYGPKSIVYHGPCKLQSIRFLNKFPSSSGTVSTFSCLYFMYSFRYFCYLFSK
jgi:hypothetical protein